MPLDPINPSGKFITPVERAVQEQLGLEPGLDRASILPIAGRRSEGNLQLAAPQFIYDLAKAFVAPGVAASGQDVSTEEAVNAAMGFTGSGLVGSHIAGPTGQGILGMAVKQKGGEWLPETISDFTRKFKKPTGNLTDAQGNIVGVAQGSEPRAAVNNWVDTQMTKYIRNQMGTPEDPVRKLADEGILHYSPNPEDDIIPGRNIRRETYAETPEGEIWEDRTDATISNFPAKTYAPNPDPASTYPLDVIARKAPETPIHQLFPSSTRDDLGFQHLTDELYNAVDPNNNLPQQLKLQPKQLAKMNMEQAVRHVNKINKWREKTQNEANLALANNPATFDFKKYDDGNKWVELKQPDTPNARKELSEALEYEGKAMGHCVGGYCDDVMERGTQIFSLRDKKGEPHVTIEVQQLTPFDSYDRTIDVVEEVFDHIPQEALEKWRINFSVASPLKEAKKKFIKSIAEDVGKYTDDPTSLGLEVMEMIAPGSSKTLPTDPAIMQVKGKGNKQPAPKYIEQIKDFIKQTGYEVFEPGPWDE